MGYGIITLLPALLVIVVAIKSKRTTEALLIGCVSSYLIIATANKSNPVTLMVDWFFKVVTDYDTVWLLIVSGSVFYTHVRAHETKANIVCHILLDKIKYTSPSPLDRT